MFLWRNIGGHNCRHTRGSELCTIAPVEDELHEMWRKLDEIHTRLSIMEASKSMNGKKILLGLSGTLAVLLVATIGTIWSAGGERAVVLLEIQTLKAQQKIDDSNWQQLHVIEAEVKAIAREQSRILS